VLVLDSHRAVIVRAGVQNWLRAESDSARIGIEFGLHPHKQGV
jgi:hypothetical protein